MEALDKALERQARRRPASILDPVVVKTVDDLKRVLAEFDPARAKPAGDVELRTNMSVIENGRATAFQVSAKTRSQSKRDLLLAGLAMIERRQEVIDKAGNAEPTEINGRQVRPAPMGNSIIGMSWVDPLIRQWLGGQRNGTKIVWDLDDGYRYEYDAAAHRLSREKR